MFTIGNGPGPWWSPRRYRVRIRRPGRPLPTPSFFSGGASSPEGLSAWESLNGDPAPWMVADGYFEVQPRTGGIRTKQGFGDVQLHVEWSAPMPPDGEDQNRGNSGVFLMETYEVQVLDSYENDTYPDGQAAALYGQYPPLVNAMSAPGEWNVYDIVFRRPRFDEDGALVSPAFVTVFPQRRTGAEPRGNDRAFGAPVAAAVRGPRRPASDFLAGSRPPGAFSEYLGQGTGVGKGIRPGLL